MNAADAAVRVRITTDGTCFIDDEFFAPPPGASLNEAVLSRLRLEAAALDAPVRAVIHDEQAHYTLAIQVNRDGTSEPLSDDSTKAQGAAQAETPVAAPPGPSTAQPPVALPWDEPLAVDRPYEPLPEPYRARLEGICATAGEGRFPEAATSADALISELTAKYGPTHPYTLAAGSVRGDIAWLMRDDRYALQIWAFVARAWHSLLGSTHKTTVRAVSNAVGCWRRLPPTRALIMGDEVISLLQEVPIPRAEPNLRAIRQRLQRLTATN
ncbi:hypothetical protein LUX12_16275 [Streptomyces somaliensis]|uniref:hypothetical protein n=1 Tax=Streptomyces somaliensis TaxID=78355 RepID=UPI0020CC9552|nr:hypothetical protein [Streptomyces somaliensis]MCP9945997.1 hypothetical protein [Streptomyces somaliensis]MCP9960835.1 hypothetical protein [Streptomyces somaliensis]